MSKKPAKPTTAPQDDAAVHKKVLINKRFHIENLEERLNRLEQDNKKLIDDRDHLEKELKDKNTDYNQEKDQHRKQEETFIKERTELEYQSRTQIKNLEEQLKNEKNGREEDAQRFTNEIKEKNRDLEDKQQTIQKGEQAVREQESLINEKNRLLSDIEKLKLEMKTKLADKEKEKVRATDKLKKDMLNNIQETKTNLLALKQEQLETTTNLTAIQNNQLTTELEYQSKQTEKLLFKNSKMNEQIQAFKRDVVIHKQVEQELAKRSHFSQKLVKKLSNRIKELEAELENSKKDQEQSSIIKESVNPGEDQKKEIGQLEKQLHQLEKKLAKQQNDNDILKNENNYIQTNLDQIEFRYQNLAALASFQLEELRQKDLAGNIDVDLQVLKTKPVELWTHEQRSAILNIILEQSKPFLTNKNLQILEPQKLNIQILDSQQESQELQLPKIDNNLNLESKNTTINRFSNVPIDVSTKIVKSNLRDWGNPINKKQTKNNKPFTTKYRV